jgi:transcriptional regulator with XRE-family HTH domain
MVSKTSTSAIAMGKRLRLLRETANLTIMEFSKLAGVSYPSISYWENGTSSITTEKMEQLITCYEQLGFNIDEKWIRRGENNPPTYHGKMIRWEPEEESSTSISPSHSTLAPIDLSTQLATILAEEMRLFTALDQAVIVKIDHSYLAPYFDKGDHVGGLWQPAAGIHFIEPTVCIFNWNSQLHVACLEKSKDEDKFIISYNKSLSSSHTGLDKIAPISRLWR